jgi:hypothetical protein
MIKNEKGVTIIALAITMIIAFILLGTITFSANTSIKLKDLNNMYTDIKTLEDTVALFYLNYGTVPVKGGENPIMSIPSGIYSGGQPVINPNDGNYYYYIDLSQLDNISLTYGTDEDDLEDRYIINARTNMIYYLKGIENDGLIYHSLPINYRSLEGFFN